MNSNETESKLENPTHTFREMNLVPQLIQESEIKCKLVMSWSSQKKKKRIFCTIYFVPRKFFKHLCLISMQSVLSKLSEYIYTYILLRTKKHCFIHLCCLFLKSPKAFSVSLIWHKDLLDKNLGYF